MFCRKAPSPGNPARACALAAGKSLTPRGVARREFRAVAKETRQSKESLAAHARVLCFLHLGFPCVWGGWGRVSPSACASPCKSQGTRGILHRPSAHAVRGNRLEQGRSSRRGRRGRAAGGVFPRFPPSRSPWQPCGGCRVRATGKTGRCAQAPPGPGFPLSAAGATRTKELPYAAVQNSWVSPARLPHLLSQHLVEAGELGVQGQHGLR